MRRATLVATVLLVTIGGADSRAQVTDDMRADLSSGMTNDLKALAVNTPVWLAQHLPAIMPASGHGTGIELNDDAGGFMIGIPVKIGLMNNFHSIGYGGSLLEFDEKVPTDLPWPQLGLVLGVGLGSGVELSLEGIFIPEVDIAAGKNITVTTALVTAALSLRVRLNDADGGMPAFTLGLGGSYYYGLMKIGAGYRSEYSTQLEGQTVTGVYQVETAPRMFWHLFQANLELRAAWTVGIWRPYLGIGLDFNFGEVTSDFNINARADITSVAGQPVNENVATTSEKVGFTAEPALFTARPLVGMDFVIGIFAITLQVDLAVMTAQPLDADLGGAAGSFASTDGNVLYNQASAGTTTNYALVGTLAIRFQI